MNASTQAIRTLAASRGESRRTNKDLRVTMGEAGHDISNARSLEEVLARADLNWTAKMAQVVYQPEGFRGDFKVDDKRVIYRDDNGLDLGVTSDHFKIFQPADVGLFFQDLCERHGFVMSRAGTYKGGKVIFAKAKVGTMLRIHGNDLVEGEIQFVTSFDGSLATTIRFGTKRLICTNGLTVGVDIVPVISVKHRSIVNVQEVKLQLGLTGVYEAFEVQADRMASKKVDTRQAIEYFMQVYYDMKAEQMVDAQADKSKKMDETIARLAQHFIASPGADLPSAKGTAWGLLNAVTYDVDHVANARSEEGRSFSALFGAGEKLKNKARDLALHLAA
jgi:phage/plasmid-like protein (TIGR03299 family)